MGGGGRIGIVGRPLPPAPRPQVPRLDPPPQPLAQANKRYNPASVYGGGPRRDSDERLENYHPQILDIQKCSYGQGWHFFPKVIGCVFFSQQIHTGQVIM